MAVTLAICTIVSENDHCRSKHGPERFKNIQTKYYTLTVLSFVSCLVFKRVTTSHETPTAYINRTDNVTNCIHQQDRQCHQLHTSTGQTMLPTAYINRTDNVTNCIHQQDRQCHQLHTSTGQTMSPTAYINRTDNVTKCIHQQDRQCHQMHTSTGQTMYV